LVKRFAELVFLSMSIVTGATTAAAQGFNVDNRNPPSITVSGPQAFASIEGRFVISLPETVSAYQPVSQKTAAGTVTGESYAWTMAEGRFQVIYFDLAQSRQLPNFEITLDDAREQLLQQMVALDGKLINEAIISLPGSHGRELRMEMPDGLLTFRIYSAGNRIYQVSASLSRHQRHHAALAARVLDSFKLLTREDADAILKRKIVEATPTPVPQAPIALKARPDSEDSGLKGRVRSLAIEDEDLTGTWVVGRRKPSSTEYFDERGNLTREEAYDSRGNLSDITVYGYIDGERVSNSRHIRYGYEPPPKAPDSRAVPSKAAAAAAPKGDSRYTSKYRYGYDGGNLIQVEVYDNDGSLRRRYVYRLSDNRREEIVFAPDASVEQKTVSALDAQGNVTQMTEYEGGSTVVRNRYTYTYEFDANGNWIKRTTAKRVIRNDQPRFEPAWVTYRTITYYQSGATN
jgi:hypothetical protein